MQSIDETETLVLSSSSECPIEDLSKRLPASDPCMLLLPLSALFLTTLYQQAFAFYAWSHNHGGARRDIGRYLPLLNARDLTIHPFNALKSLFIHVHPRAPSRIAWCTRCKLALFTTLRSPIWPTRLRLCRIERSKRPTQASLMKLSS